MRGDQFILTRKDYYRCNRELFYSAIRNLDGSVDVIDAFNQHKTYALNDFLAAFERVPLLPQSVKDYILRAKRKDINLVTVMAACYKAEMFVEDPDEVMTWINQNADTFAEAWLLYPQANQE